MVERGWQHDRLEDAAGVRDNPARLTDVEQQIARLETLREVLAHGDEMPDLEPRTRSESAYDEGQARDDGSRGR
jgi:hypothetical protein